MSTIKKSSNEKENHDFVISSAKASGLSQRDFAKAIGFHYNTVNAVLSGKTPPSHKFVTAVRMFSDKTDRRESHQVQEELHSGTPRSLLKTAREAKDMSQKDLARATGYGIGYIQALEENGARLSEKFAEKVAEVLEIEKEDLMRGSDHPPVTGETAGMVGTKPNITTIGDISVRYIPLISWSQAGMLTDFTDEVYDYEGHLAVDIKDPKAIAVRIRGDSMQPRFHEGDVAILSPSTQAQTGDLVIARIRDQGVIFKRLQVAGRTYQFISINERYPMLEFDAEEIDWVYPVKSVTVNTL